MGVWWGAPGLGRGSQTEPPPITEPPPPLHSTTWCWMAVDLDLRTDLLKTLPPTRGTGDAKC